LSTACELTNKLLQWLGYGITFLNVNTGFFAQQQVQFCLEKNAPARLALAGFSSSTANEKLAPDAKETEEK